MSILSLIVWSLIIGYTLYILRKFFNGPKTPLTKSMIGKIVVITGCNTGIGRETALDLLEKGAKVILACRDENKTTALINSIKEEKVKENAYFIKLDLCSFNSINNFAQEFKSTFGKFDILINNAGGVFDNFTLKEGIETSIMTNHIGHTVLTALLLDNINPEGKIINVSSYAHCFIKENQFNNILNDIEFRQFESSYSPFNIYSFTKLANILHAIQLDEYVRKRNLKIKTASLHPGTVASEFLGRGNTTLFKIISFASIPFQKIFFKDCKMGAQTTLHLCYMDYHKLNSGAYFSDCAESNKHNVITENSQNVNKLMEYSKQLIRKNMSNIPREVENYLEQI